MGRQQAAKDTFTLLASLSDWDVMHAAPDLAGALERLANFAATGDADADASLERFRDLRKRQAFQARAKAGRAALIAEAERHPSVCLAHRRPVRWQPSPCWWYHADAPSNVPHELSQCREMLKARAPAGRAA